MALSLACASLLTSCGKNFYFAGRNLPPSGVLNRVLIAEQNPSGFTKGALPFVDAYYDIRQPYNQTNGTPFSISGYSGALPVTIQNMPEEQTGAVYGAGDGSFTLINYAQEKAGASIKIPGGLSTSIFITRGRDFVYAANGTTHVVSVVDVANGDASYALNLPNAYAVSINPGGTIALVFTQNSTQPAGDSSCLVANPSANPNGASPSAGAANACDVAPGQFAVYSVVMLTTAEQTAAAASTDPQHYLGAQDCEPQNLPVFCAFPVSTGANASFDHPVKAVFSPDGSAAYVLDCGPECGGTTAGVTEIPLTSDELNTNTSGAKGIALVAQTNIAIPGGVTNGIFNGNQLYLAGQQLQTSGPYAGLFQGYLSLLNTQTGQVSGPWAISDGTHNKMVFGDDNTLWIGSVQCEHGVTYAEAQASGGKMNYGCLTMFNTSTDKATLDAYKGDATGIAAVTGLHKVYTAEGGQVYIYSTKDMSELNNFNVTVTGTATDVAYMDAGSDGDNTTY